MRGEHSTRLHRPELDLNYLIKYLITCSADLHRLELDLELVLRREQRRLLLLELGLLVLDRQPQQLTLEAGPERSVRWLPPPHGLA